MALRRSFYYSFARTGGQGIIQFLTNIVLARLLAPAEIGLFVIAFAFVTTLGAVRDFGIPRYIIKEQELTQEKMQSVFALALIIGWGLAICLIAIREAAASFYGDPAISKILLILSGSFFFLPFGQLSLALLRREEKHGPIAVVTITAAFAGSFVSIILVLLGYGPSGMAYGALATALVTSVLALKQQPSHFWLRPSLKEWKSIFGFGVVTTLGTIVAQLMLHAPVLLLGRLMGFAETGFFQRAFSFVHFTTGVLTTSSNWVTGAAIGTRQRAGEDISRLLLETTGVLAAAGWPILVMIALKADAAILFLYGPAWLPAADLLPPICVAGGVMLLVSQSVGLYEGTGAAGAFLRNNLLALLALVAFLVIGTNYGLVATAWMRVPAVMIAVGLHLWALWQLAGVTPWQVLASVRRAFAIAIVTGLFLQTLILLEPAGYDRNALVMFAELALTGGVYIGLLLVLRHPLGEELRGVVIKLLKR